MTSMRSARAGRNRVEQIRRANEQHIGKIERQIQIMIAESVILLGVQDLQQRRRRIAAKIGADFVDLVEHENRIVRTRLLDTLNDAPWQRADVSAPVAANLRFVAHAAERDAHEISAEGAGDGSA